MPCYGGALRRNAGRSIVLIASLAALAVPTAAQLANQPPQAATPLPDAIKQREQELEAAREQQKNAAELQQKLKAEVAAIGQDRSQLNAQLITIAAQVRAVEGRIGDAGHAFVRSTRVKGKSAVRSIRGAPRWWRFWPPCSAPAEERLRRCWCGPKMRCNRFVPLYCLDPSCPRCGRALKHSPATLPSW